MVPTTSALRLNDYFVTGISVQANRSFNPVAAMNLAIGDITVETQAEPAKGEAGKNAAWAVNLRVFYQGKAGVNTPYLFSIELVGNFSVAPGHAPEKDEWLVKTNGSSVLYSTAREILRSAMSQGPYRPFLLPAVSFYTEETKGAIARINNKNRSTEALLSSTGTAKTVRHSI